MARSKQPARAAPKTTVRIQKKRPGQRKTTPVSPDVAKFLLDRRSNVESAVKTATEDICGALDISTAQFTTMVQEAVKNATRGQDETTTELQLKSTEQAILQQARNDKFTNDALKAFVAIATLT